MGRDSQRSHRLATPSQQTGYSSTSQQLQTLSSEGAGQFRRFLS